MKILITGAGGFIGSFLVDEALRRGMEVYAAVRRTTVRRYLTDPRIHFVEADLSGSGRIALEEQFDYAVHAAGVTKSADATNFDRVNYGGTKALVEALTASSPKLKKFIFISSLSVMGAIAESEPHREITAADSPQPNTAYGRSKLKAEKYLDSITAFPIVTLRPTGVYGPREKDYLLMVQSIARHMDFAAGYKRQDITFIYVADLVQAVFKALETGRAGEKYLLSDGNTYTSRTFSELIKKELGTWALRITAPLWLLKAVTTAGEMIGRRTGRVTALNADKYNILSQRNWKCDITPAREQLGFAPEYDLERGVKETISWYKGVKN